MNAGQRAPLVDASGRVGYCPACVRLGLRLVNVGIAVVTLASALAVLAADLFDPGYRAHYRDALWFVAAYAAVQVVVLVAFARDWRLVPWLAVAKAAAAFAFLANFVALWPTWQTWTPARYVYQLFAWDEGSRTGLFALVFLGRGAFNALNAMYFTQAWWVPLRLRHPVAGRAVTAVPVAATAFSVWAFLALVHEEARTFSPEAQDVARAVLETLDCEAVRTLAGTTTTDLRQRGERHYQVQIAYGCALTRIVVHAEDGRMGTVAASRPECCAGAADTPTGQRNAGRKRPMKAGRSTSVLLADTSIASATSAPSWTWMLKPDRQRVAYPSAIAVDTNTIAFPDVIIARGRASSSAAPAASSSRRRKRKYKA